MSFTAEVKDELSRVEPGSELCEIAQLSALIRVCGTLSFRGPGRYSLRVSTETGAVARTVFLLSHRLFDLKTELTYRRSVLHKTRNYLIEIPEQDGLEEILVRLGILVPGRGLATGVPAHLTSDPAAREAFIRGAFMAGGFIADPRGDFHLEVAVTGEDFAPGLVSLMAMEGVNARLNHRRGAFAIYLKSFEGVVALLRAMGAQRSATAVERVRLLKEKKNKANRVRNADMANIARTSSASIEQMSTIDELERLVPLSTLPPALQQFCRLRRENPGISLADLGELADPPASKSAMYHRLLRIGQILDEARKAQDA